MAALLLINIYYMNVILTVEFCHEIKLPKKQDNDMNFKNLMLIIFLQMKIK